MLSHLFRPTQFFLVKVKKVLLLWADKQFSSVVFSTLENNKMKSHFHIIEIETHPLCALQTYTSIYYYLRWKYFTQLFSGLTIGATVVQGEYGKMYAESQAARVSLRQVINSECVKGFPEVVVGDNISDCICHMWVFGTDPGLIYQGLRFTVNACVTYLGAMRNLYLLCIGTDTFPTGIDT